MPQRLTETVHIFAPPRYLPSLKQFDKKTCNADGVLVSLSLSLNVMKTVSPSRIEAARKIFERHGGTMRTSEAMAAGIHPEVLYAMRDAGGIEPLARGLYHLTAAPDLGNLDLVTVSMKIPRGVICMLSALSFHALTTHIPTAVDVGLTRGSEPPRID